MRFFPRQTSRSLFRPRPRTKQQKTLTFIVSSSSFCSASASFAPASCRVVEHKVVSGGQPSGAATAALVVARQRDTSERALLSFAAKPAAAAACSRSSFGPGRCFPADSHALPRRGGARGLVFVGLCVDARGQGRLKRVAVLVRGAQRLQLQRLGGFPRRGFLGSHLSVALSCLPFAAALFPPIRLHRRGSRHRDPPSAPVLAPVPLLVGRRAHQPRDESAVQDHGSPRAEVDVEAPQARRRRRRVAAQQQHGVLAPQRHVTQHERVSPPTGITLERRVSQGRGSVEAAGAQPRGGQVRDGARGGADASGRVAEPAPRGLAEQDALRN